MRLHFGIFAVFTSVHALAGCQRTTTDPPSLTQPASLPSASAVEPPASAPVVNTAPPTRNIGKWSNGESAAAWFSPEADPPPADLFPAPTDAEELQPGIKLKIIKRGKRKGSPQLGQMVTFHQQAWSATGQTLENTRRTKSPTKLALDEASHLSRILQRLTVGDVARAWVSPEVAFAGNQGFPLLGYVLELLTIDDSYKAPAAPDLSAPSTARRQAGADWVVLAPGKDSLQPDYSCVFKAVRHAWTRDGKPLAGTPAPAVFHLDNLLPGERNIVASMTIGEHRRIWTEKAVVDIELVDIAYYPRLGNR